MHRMITMHARPSRRDRQTDEHQAFYRAIREGGLGSRNSVRPSVRLSVRLSHAWIVTKLNECGNP